MGAQLDAALAVLVVTAELAGVHANSEDGSLLTLAVNPADMGRRALWQAWEVGSGRTQRWGALHKLGANIRAADLADITPYRRPRDIEHRLEREPGAPPGIYRTVAHDPESPNYRPPADPEKQMIPGKRLGRVVIR